MAAAIADAQGTTIAAVEKQAGSGKPKLSEGLSAQRAFADLACRAASELRPGLGEKLIANAASPMAAPGAAPRDCSEVCPEHSYDMSFGAVLRYVGWGYLMLRSREYHLTTYLRLARRQSEAPAAMLNHLVDYDAWLGVDRLPGSSHVEQVEVAHGHHSSWSGGLVQAKLAS